MSSLQEQKLNPAWYIKQQFEKRKLKNPSYSLRAFARDLQMSASRLSELMNRNGNISVELAKKIVVRLTDDKGERQLFTDLALIGQQRTSLARDLAVVRCQTYLQSLSKTELTVDSFLLVKEWYHLAILELIKTHDFRSDLSWISQRIGVSGPVVLKALARLERAGMIEVIEDDILLPEANYGVYPKAGSDAVRTYHKAVISKAVHALDDLPFDQRYAGSLILAMKQENYQNAINTLGEFRTTFDERFSVQSGGDELFYLSMQFFPATRQIKSDNSSHKTNQ
ncbi:MAG: TIGR02147 family protein [Pseudobacteriovorax sp.]|nr:TIGR02147 family protein [Pseudobacteriovorax sp.]